MNDNNYMLWLSSMVQFFGSRKLNSLLIEFGSARNIFNATQKELEQYLTSHGLQTITRQRSLYYIEKLLNKMEEQGIIYLSREHERFPELLKTIPDPPIGLFCIGTLPPDTMYKVAIIGSRTCSEYGKMAAQLLATPLAQTNVVIVSGMARGVDSAAHKGALTGGGKTIAVLGCGIDICYPSENAHLRDEIINNGCIISEYSLGIAPNKAFFPARNRIISGLSHGVVVTEAGKQSGTLITVDQALDQGREVMAVPGNVSSGLSEGTNRLIREGAHLVACHTDVLFVLNIPERDMERPIENKTTTPLSKGNEVERSPAEWRGLGQHPIENKATQSLSEGNVAGVSPAERRGFGGSAPIKIEKQQNNPNKNLAPLEKEVYDSLNLEAVSFDILLERTSLDAGQLNLACVNLELKGLIKKLPGSRYIRSM